MTASIIGVNIRRLREAQGVSLSGLARHSGIAKATLSALESGSSNPTIATLEALSGALNVPLRELLAGQAEPSTWVVRGTGAGSGDSNDRLVESFSPRGVVEVYDIRFTPGTRIVYEAHAEGVVERVLVQEGVLLAGPVNEPVELQPGDFITFLADRDHCYASVEGTVRGALIVSYPAASPPQVPLHAKLSRVTDEDALSPSSGAASERP
ncbi:MAG: XRE family transcriptional regulator [Actinomycetota bacterium]|nr:XRE family transcriptional regulator [Actinomycetota bacterium]